MKVRGGRFKATPLWPLLQILLLLLQPLTSSASSFAKSPRAADPGDDDERGSSSSSPAIPDGGFSRGKTGPASNDEELPSPVPGDGVGEFRRRRLDCKCSIVDSSSTGFEVVCGEFHTPRQLCLKAQFRDEEGILGEVTSLTFTKSLRLLAPLIRSLRLDRPTLARLGVADPARLRSIEVTKTSIGDLRICCRDCSDDEGDLFPCTEFVGLERLDLRGNALAAMPDLTEMPVLKELRMSGNPWRCFDGLPPSSPHSAVRRLSWLLDSPLDAGDAPLCARPVSNRWHQNVTDGSADNATEVPLLHFLNFSRVMESTCPDRCSCRLMSTVLPLLVRVNCRNASLDAMPARLPENTRALDVSFNKISSLRPVATNPSYRHLKQLSARGNLLLTMSHLAGSPFITRNLPTTIDLQDNQLQKLDTALLEPVLSVIKRRHFQDALSLLFAGNPWDCACDNLRQMQTFIYKYEALLRDSQFMACGRMQDPVIISAEYEKLCQPSSFDYLLVVVAVEIILLILVLSKLIYDVVMYKRTGELPWLARHICLGYSYAGLGKPGENRHKLCGCGEVEDGLGSSSGGGGSQQAVSSSSPRSGGTNGPKRSGGAMQFFDAFRPRRQTSASSVFTLVAGGANGHPLHPPHSGHPGKRSTSSATDAHEVNNGKRLNANSGQRSRSHLTLHLNKLQQHQQYLRQQQRQDFGRGIGNKGGKKRSRHLSLEERRMMLKERWREDAEIF